MGGPVNEWCSSAFNFPIWKVMSLFRAIGDMENGSSVKWGAVDEKKTNLLLILDFSDWGGRGGGEEGV